MPYIFPFVSKVCSHSKVSVIELFVQEQDALRVRRKKFFMCITEVWSIHVNFCKFPCRSDLCKDKMLCGISDNFSWQTIWDLSKQFLLEEIQASLKFSDFHKTLPFVLYNTRYGCIPWQFCKFFTFRDLGAVTRCSAGSQIIFPDKQSETRQKKILLEEIQGSLIFSDFHKNCHLCYITPNMSALYDNFESFSHLEFLSAGTRCSAGSQKIFPDKQSETCPNNFCSKKSRPLLNSVIFTKCCRLCCIPLDMSPFYAKFASFSHFEFWVPGQGALRDLR